MTSDDSHTTTHTIDPAAFHHLFNTLNTSAPTNTSSDPPNDTTTHISNIFNLSNLNYSCITITDHLPPDLIRSLWLIQNLNLSFEKRQSLLNDKLIEFKSLIEFESNLNLSIFNRNRNKLTTSSSSSSGNNTNNNIHIFHKKTKLIWEIKSLINNLKLINYESQKESIKFKSLLTFSSNYLNNSIYTLINHYYSILKLSISKNLSNKNLSSKNKNQLKNTKTNKIIKIINNFSITNKNNFKNNYTNDLLFNDYIINSNTNGNDTINDDNNNKEKTLNFNSHDTFFKDLLKSSNQNLFSFINDFKNFNIHLNNNLLKKNEILKKTSKSQKLPKLKIKIPPLSSINDSLINTPTSIPNSPSINITNQSQESPKLPTITSLISNDKQRPRLTFKLPIPKSLSSPLNFPSNNIINNNNDDNIENDLIFQNQNQTSLLNDNSSSQRSRRPQRSLKKQYNKQFIVPRIASRLRSNTLLDDSNIQGLTRLRKERTKKQSNNHDHDYDHNHNHNHNLNHNHNYIHFSFSESPLLNEFPDKIINQDQPVNKEKNDIYNSNEKEKSPLPTQEIDQKTFNIIENENEKQTNGYLNTNQINNQTNNQTNNQMNEHPIQNNISQENIQNETIPKNLNANQKEKPKRRKQHRNSFLNTNNIIPLNDFNNRRAFRSSSVFTPVDNRNIRNGVKKNENFLKFDKRKKYTEHELVNEKQMGMGIEMEIEIDTLGSKKVKKEKLENSFNQKDEFIRRRSQRVFLLDKIKEDQLKEKEINTKNTNSNKEKQEKKENTTFKNSKNSKKTKKSTKEHKNIDVKEERYCYCNDISYGPMIGCDNDSCKYGWFHYPCINMLRAPSALKKWYCPTCKEEMDKKEEQKKNKKQIINNSKIGKNWKKKPGNFQRVVRNIKKPHTGWVHKKVTKVFNYTLNGFRVAKEDKSISNNVVGKKKPGPRKRRSLRGYGRLLKELEPYNVAGAKDVTPIEVQNEVAEKLHEAEELLQQDVVNEVLGESADSEMSIMKPRKARKKRILKELEAFNADGEQEANAFGLSPTFPIRELRNHKSKEMLEFPDETSLINTSIGDGNYSLKPVNEKHGKHNKEEIPLNMGKRKREDENSLFTSKRRQLRSSFVPRS
ncbi:uncharacterized protein ASCRUDRAFT_114458 [Ascoidea rubescens DSM 1968]|uniref:Zinc finger PHD-type domain-containing protein n=1 Tax=Ascoidea rubescens DSM 1968 TaxID=1344418 RepID=A0A1D2VC74_9ASCO|nr:hypothetical protein ASCRUDRAFT_114458 [Ascoidea rubescens DSM 1968]ODV59278.1 hypothetical protein ASCRUDRAFT_114458 [Ascoidea rubescens DSM 1968]